MASSKARGHHFLPRFFLRHFASRTRRRHAYAFLFRVGQIPVEVNTGNVGKVRDFHGDPRTSDLEVQVSHLEASYARLLETLIAKREVLEADRSLVAEFVTHLLVRTRHVREGVGDAFDSLLHFFGGVLDEITNDQIRTELRKAMEANPTMAQRLSTLSAAQRDAVLNSVFDHLDYDWARKAIGEHFREYRSAIDVRDIMAEAHQGALAKRLPHLSETERAAALREIHWHVQLSTGPPLILGDVVAIARASGSPLFSNAVMVDWPPELICMPLSPQHLLVGCTAGPPPQIASEDANIAFAELSREFFVSRQKTDDENRYFCALGKRSSLIPASDL